MIQEPPESNYDLHFQVFGFPTRVTWGFWIAAIVLGWGACNSWDRSFSQMDVESPGAPILLIIWSAAMFVSILVHELGHALAMRFYGLQSRMVLYHMGGLAIANSFGAWNGARRGTLNANQSLIISAAGPAAQLMLAAVLYAVGRYFGMELELDTLLSNYFGITTPEVELPSSAAAYALFNSLVTPSVLWALLNLLPILPLDGGNIMLQLLTLTKHRDTQRTAHLVSIFVAVLVAAYCLQTGNSMLALMCFAFAATNWQQLQFMSGRF